MPLYIKNSDITSVTWDIEPETYLGGESSPDEIANYVIDNAKCGSIILLHSMYKAGDTLTAIKKIAMTLKAEGYTFCTVEELIK